MTFGFKFPASGSLPVILSSLIKTARSLLFTVRSAGSCPHSVQKLYDRRQNIGELNGTSSPCLPPGGMARDIESTLFLAKISKLAFAKCKPCYGRSCLKYCDA